MGSLIDIHPAEVAATETYGYKAGIGSNDYVEAGGLPQGHITVGLPYDGEKYFPVGCAEELREGPGLQTLKIGAVALGKPKDWKGDWKQQTGFELLDVELPLRTAGVTEEQWTADELWLQCSHDYNPELPGYFPIQVLLKVLDSYTVPPTLLWGDGYKENAVWEYLAKAGTRIERDNVLRLEFRIQANLPSILGGETLVVHLETLRFSWPGIPARRQFRFFHWDPGKMELVELSWDYEPAGREILLKDVPMRPVSQRKNGNPLTTYEASIYMELLFASGRLAEEDHLSGKAVVRVDNTLLSGRDVTWIQASGARAGSSVQVIRQTFLKSEFDASLSEQFNEKRSFISRHWVFPGVSFQPARYNDVVAVLLDMGYVPDPPNENKEEDEGKIIVKQQVIQAGQGQYELYIWIQLAEELTITTTRERKLEEDEILPDRNLHPGAGDQLLRSNGWRRGNPDPGCGEPDAAPERPVRRRGGSALGEWSWKQVFLPKEAWFAATSAAPPTWNVFAIIAGRRCVANTGL